MKKTTVTFYLAPAQRTDAVNALDNHASCSAIKSYRQRLRQIRDRIETADWKRDDVKLTAAQADAFYDFADNMAFVSHEQRFEPNQEESASYRTWIKIRKAVGSSIGRKASRLDAVGHAKPLSETITKADVADEKTRQLISDYEKAETAFQLICDIVGDNKEDRQFRDSANFFSCALRRELFARIPALKTVNVNNGEAVLIIKN